MPFHAAKDLVYTISGGNISSGGYRISKIMNSNSSNKKNKSKGNKQFGGKVGIEGDGPNDFFKEDSGIPIGLLLLQRLPYNFHDENEENREEKREYEYKQDNYDNNHKANNNIMGSKLVYANIMTNADADNNDDDENIELVVMSPTQQSLPLCSIENPIEISSNEIDDDVYNVLLTNVSNPEVMNGSLLTPFRRATKKQHFGKHIEKVFQKRKTKSKRHEK